LNGLLISNVADQPFRHFARLSNGRNCLLNTVFIDIYADNNCPFLRHSNGNRAPETSANSSHDRHFA